MRTVINVNSGGDINKLLIPGRYRLSPGGSYYNLSTPASGNDCYVTVEYTTNTAINILQTIVYRRGNVPMTIRRFIASNSADPYPSGRFTYANWYADAEPTILM